jgi:hypothetical protein
MERRSGRRKDQISGSSDGGATDCGCARGPRGSSTRSAGLSVQQRDREREEPPGTRKRRKGEPRRGRIGSQHRNAGAKSPAGGEEPEPSPRGRAEVSTTLLPKRREGGRPRWRLQTAAPYDRPRGKPVEWYVCTFTEGGLARGRRALRTSPGRTSRPERKRGGGRVCKRSKNERTHTYERLPPLPLSEFRPHIVAVFSSGH